MVEIGSTDYMEWTCEGGLKLQNCESRSRRGSNPLSERAYVSMQQRGRVDGKQGGTAEVLSFCPFLEGQRLFLVMRNVIRIGREQAERRGVHGKTEASDKGKNSW